MTPEEIDAMPAGPEMDVLLASRLSIGPRVAGSGGWVEPSGRMRPQPFSPSTDMADTDKVISSVRALKGFNEFELFENSDGTYTARFRLAEGFPVAAEAHATTPELAACRAALKAVK